MPSTGNEIEDLLEEPTFKVEKWSELDKLEAKVKNTVRQFEMEKENNEINSLRWYKESFVPQYKDRGKEGKELKTEINWVCKTEDDF